MNENKTQACSFVCRVGPPQPDPTQPEPEPEPASSTASSSSSPPPLSNCVWLRAAEVEAEAEANAGCPCRLPRPRAPSTCRQSITNKIRFPWWPAGRPAGRGASRSPAARRRTASISMAVAFLMLGLGFLLGLLSLAIAEGLALLWAIRSLTRRPSPSASEATPPGLPVHHPPRSVSVSRHSLNRQVTLGIHASHSYSSLLSIPIQSNPIQSVKQILASKRARLSLN